MKNRILSIILTVLMLVTAIPFAAFATETEALPTIYVMEDVYGAPGETVSVRIGFKNTDGKAIQQFEACLNAGGAEIVESIALQITPTPAQGGAGVVNSNNGRFSYACGIGSFSADSYATVNVTIPADAKDGDSYPLTLSASDQFAKVLVWEDESSAEGNVAFEGATLYVSTYDPVTVTVKDVVASVGDSQIRVPVVMSATDGKLASCSQITFAVTGSAAEKVVFNAYASKEYKIQGVNEGYTVVIPDAQLLTLSFTASLGFASGYENAVAPEADDFKIFELVFDVVAPLEEGDTLTVTPIGEDPFKAYGESATDLINLIVKDYVAGTVTTELPYEWEVVDEEAATARLLKYTGTAATVEIPSAVTGNGTVGTEGKKYTVVELYGNADEESGVFYANETVVSIKIPESVKTVNEFAIGECPALKSLIVKSPDLVITEEIGEVFLYYNAGSARNPKYELPGDLVIHSYESATIKTWSDDNGAEFANLFAFAGAQVGDNGIRFIGAVADLEYDDIDLLIKVESENKSFSKSGHWVYKTLNGTVDGVLTPMVTTDAEVASETGAYLVEAYEYLYGYAIEGVPTTGTYVFEITPSATTCGGATVYGETVSITFTDGQIQATIIA